MSLISVNNLTFAYEGSYDNIFENTSFQIDTDWKLGFTGRNGRGKTTFLNLLLGKYEYSGTISSSLPYEYFPYEVDDLTGNTIDIAEGICDFEIWELQRELSLLEVSEDVLYRPFGTLSNGERTKVLLAVLFLKDNHYLLIDEPTNHLDMHGRGILSKYFSSKKSYILVSHDRAFLDGCVDHILSINKANIEVQKGNFTSWLQNKERQDQFELAENEKLKKEITRLEKTASQKAAWSDISESKKIGFDPTVTEKSMGRRPYEAAKSKKMMKRAKVIENRQLAKIEEKSTLLRNLESTDTLKIDQIPYHSNRLVSLNNVSIYYGDKTVFENISITVEKGDRVALRGRNGAGKSSIIKLINGENIPYRGDFKRGSQLITSYVSQGTSFLCGNLSDFAVEHKIDESLFKAILRKLDFSRIQFEKDMADFSGGQKKKVLIAKSLCEKAHILIWDEPLNFIDVISRMQIENLLLEFKPTIIFVEHDKAFCENIATKIINL